MSSFFGGLSQYLGGMFGWGAGTPVATLTDQKLVKADAPVKPNEPMERMDSMGGRVYGGPGSFPGFDTAPPMTIDLAWQMRRYAIIRLAMTLIKAPVLSTPRTIEVVDDSGKSPDEVAKIKELAEKQLLPFIEQTFEAAFECLNFGNWIFDLVWDRVDGYTFPRAGRSILPGYGTIYRDIYGSFAGFQFGSEFRDSRYGLLIVNEPHLDPLWGTPRIENVREEWWRQRKSEENGDRTERKASGIQMVITAPTGISWVDDAGKPYFPKDMAQTAMNSAAKGDCLLLPGVFWSKSDALKNPDLFKASPVNIELLDHGNTGPALDSHMKRVDALDRKIMSGLHRPPREGMESNGGGTNAESQTHGQVGITDSELTAQGILNQYVRTATGEPAVVDRWLITNFGPEYAGMLAVKQGPLSDDKQTFLRDFAKTIAQDPATGPDFQLDVDKRALAEDVELPLRDMKDVQKDRDAKAAEDAAQKLADAKAMTAKAQGLNGNGKAPAAGRMT